MTTSTWTWAFAVLSACALTACGDDTSGSGGGSGGSGGSGSTSTAGGTSSTSATGAGGDAGAGGSGDGGGTATSSTTTSATTGGQGGAGDGGAGGAGGGPPDAEVPDVFSIVEQVAAEHPELLEINTYESCGELVQRVLMALADDPEWGHVAKTAGESQYTPPGFEPRDVDGYLVTGFSQDAIFHRATYWQVDIIANAAANSDPNPEIHGPATITWGVIEREHYRENNPWMAPVPLP